LYGKGRKYSNNYYFPFTNQLADLTADTIRSEMQQFDDRFTTNKRLSQLRQSGEENLVKSLAPQYGLSYINLRGLSINPSALKLVSESEARAAELVVFEKRNKKLSVAIKNPNNPKTKQTVATLEKGGWELNFYMCSTASLEHAWQRYQDERGTEAVKKGVLDIDPEEIKKLAKRLTNTEQVSAFLEEMRSYNTANHVTTIVEAIFAGAIALHASDIHIEPEQGDIRLRYRLDGVLHDIIDLDKRIHNRLNSRLKLLAGLILNIHDEAQDGRFTFDMGDKDVEVRVSVIPGAAGESIVMRLLDPTVASFSMDDLGLNEILYNLMQKELERPNGMIITTGPTGSGKTTALYAFLQKAHKPEVKIITIEDPVEYKVDNIVQTQVEEDYTFSSGLRSILRQDPDIIMVGEIRDREVAETAIHAAQTGHLVFTTLHTNDAAGAFPRLTDLGVDPRSIGSSVNIVLAQRLARKLCDKCKTSYDASPQERKLIEKVLAGHPKPPQLSNPLKLYKATGCEACNGTGFSGRDGVFEAILMDDKVEEAVIRDPREHVIMEAARSQGIPTMAEEGIVKVLAGIFSLEELARVIDLSVLRPESIPKETI